MNQKDFLAEMRRECAEEINLCAKKNADYAEEGNPFANFELIEYVTSGRITAEQGILVRMTDKLIRVSSLLFRPAAVKDEAITDTLRDLSIYAKILKIMLGSNLKLTKAQIV